MIYGILSRVRVLWILSNGERRCTTAAKYVRSLRSEKVEKRLHKLNGFENKRGRLNKR